MEMRKKQQKQDAHKKHAQQTQHKQRQHGFTLVEMLLVLAIASSLILMLLNYSTRKAQELRRDKTVLQIQQLLNSGLSYYVNNSKWPITCGTTTWTVPNTLTGATNNNFSGSYLPNGFSMNPYSNNYSLNCDTQASDHGGNFYVATAVSTPVDALIIAGGLPMAYITTPASVTSNAAPPAQDAACTSPPYTGCTEVVSSVNIPGQNLNNARSVNFAGIYYSGSCVPAPNCPAGMTPSIMVVPASVAGVNGNPTCQGTSASGAYDPVGSNANNSCKANLYPLTAFSAFARGGDTSTPGGPVAPGNAGSGGPNDCTISGTPSPAPCWQSYSNGTPTYITDQTTNYWRVCLAVQTQDGGVTILNNSNAIQWGKMIGNVMAFTRCVPNNGAETPSGSINVFQANKNFAQ